MNRPQVVLEQEWQAARDALLVKEKEYTRALDALAAERRRLPMVKLDPASTRSPRLTAARHRSPTCSTATGSW
jgi:hypothetical protein